MPATHRRNGMLCSTPTTQKGRLDDVLKRVRAALAARAITKATKVGGAAASTSAVCPWCAPDCET